MGRLLTPPDTPLFPSLDDEPVPVNLVHSGRTRSRPISISRSSTVSKEYDWLFMYGWYLLNHFVEYYRLFITTYSISSIHRWKKVREVVEAVLVRSVSVHLLGQAVARFVEDHLLLLIQILHLYVLALHHENHRPPQSNRQLLLQDLIELLDHLDLLLHQGWGVYPL